MTIKNKQAYFSFCFRYVLPHCGAAYIFPHFLARYMLPHSGVNPGEEALKKK
jgi:hypothetical protein